MSPRPVVFATLLFLVLACGTAAACWMHVPLDDLVGTSDAIIVGRLGTVRRVEPPRITATRRYNWYEAQIDVERTLWPERQEAKTLTLRWSTSGISTDLDHGQYTGMRALWLLQRGKLPLGGYQANYPGRTIPLTHADLVRRQRDEVKKAVSREIRAQRVLETLNTVLRELEPKRG